VADDFFQAAEEEDFYADCRRSVGHEEIVPVQR
jgi:hypothetical protein